MKGVLFDFWGTIVENGIIPSPVKQVRSILRLDMPFYEYIVRFEEAFMTDDFEDLNQAFENVCKEFKIDPDKELLDELVGMWNKNHMLCKPFEDAIELLDSLKGNYKLGLITNTPPSIRGIIEKYELDKYFDVMILSCEQGCLKTNPKMFKKALKELKLKKEEVVMVGDSIPSDMKGAENAGVKGILIDRRDKRDFENKITAMTDLNQYLEE